MMSPPKTLRTQTCSRPPASSAPARRKTSGELVSRGLPCVYLRSPRATSRCLPSASPRSAGGQAPARARVPAASGHLRRTSRRIAAGLVHAGVGGATAPAVRVRGDGDHARAHQTRRTTRTSRPPSQRSCSCLRRSLASCVAGARFPTRSTRAKLALAGSPARFRAPASFFLAPSQLTLDESNDGEPSVPAGGQCSVRAFPRLYAYLRLTTARRRYGNTLGNDGPATWPAD
jgi:hypothetical protein